MSEIFVGIDLGGTNIKIGCFDSDLRVIRKTAEPTQADMGPKVVIDKMAQTTEKLLADAGLSLQQVAAAGVGTPGPAKYKEGIIIQSTNMPKFKDVPISRMLGEKLGKTVVLENDATAACWGEYAVGAGKGVDNMAFFTLGTGIGGGIINNGKLLQGCGDNAAELGHTILYPNGRQCNCGQRGCVETYASASSTAKRASEALEAGEQSSLREVLEKQGEITCKDVYEHLAAGDTLAKRITDETAEAIAIACINVLHTVEPQRIVFAGGMIAAGEPLLNRIRYYFKEHIWSLKAETVDICFANLGEDAGIIGAAALALQAHRQSKM